MDPLVLVGAAGLVMYLLFGKKEEVVPTPEPEPEPLPYVPPEPDPGFDPDIGTKKDPYKYVKSAATAGQEDGKKQGYVDATTFRPRNPNPSPVPKDYSYNSQLTAEYQMNYVAGYNLGYETGAQAVMAGGGGGVAGIGAKTGQMYSGPATPRYPSFFTWKGPRVTRGR